MDARWRENQLEKMLNKIDRSKSNSGGCDFWNENLYCNQKGGGPKYGRLKVTYPNGQKKLMLAHRFMYMLHHNTLNLPSHMHVSHICHNSLCINPLHLSLEPNNVNIERNSCKNTVPLQCMHHEGYPDCIF